MTEDMIGRWVEYHDGFGGTERGRLKSFDNELQRAWVVFHADGRLDTPDFVNYTAEGCSYSSLSIKGGN